MNAQVNAKPSQAHDNEEILRAKAQAANQKRAQRKREQASQEAEKPRKFGKVIKVRANGVEYATLTEFVVTLPNCGKIDGKHSAYAISMWNRINGQLKKKGWTEINGIIIEAI